MEYSIEDILDKIIGSTSVACETTHDNRSIENLEEVEAIADWLIERLQDNVKWYKDYRASANNIALKTYEIIEKLNCVTNDLMEHKENIDKGDIIVI